RTRRRGWGRAELGRWRDSIHPPSTLTRAARYSPGQIANGKLMTVLGDDIAAFDRMKAELEATHWNEWVLFHGGRFVGAFQDFETCAADAVERFDLGPYLIRQVGAPP